MNGKRLKWQFCQGEGVNTPLYTLYDFVKEQDLGEKNINFVLDEKGCVAIFEGNGDISVELTGMD